MKFSPNEEQNQSADDREDESGWVKRRTGRWFGKDARDQAPHDRAADAEQRGHDKTEMLDARHNGARDPPNDETDDDRPNDV